MKTDDSLNASVEAEASPSMLRRVAGYAMRYLIPLAFTVLLLWYIFSKVNFGQMMDILRHEVTYWWILGTMGISVVSHVFRAARWRLQLRALKIEVPFMALCCSIFGTYALNLLFPRLGEVWRCTYVARLDHAPFTTVLGSMVADRLSDAITVLMLVLLTFVVAAPALNSFLAKYPVGRDLLQLVYNPTFWMALVGSILVLVGILYLARNTRIVGRLRQVVLNMWQGFAVVASMKGRGMFGFYTLCIWTCYFLQLYFAFYAFPFTRDLCFEDGTAFGLIPCLVAFVLSSIGMAVPSNGGLGPWNVAIIFGLAIYGVTEAQGTAFSMLVWSAQTVMLILLGIYTMGYISFGHASRKTSKSKATLTSSKI